MAAKKNQDRTAEEIKAGISLKEAETKKVQAETRQIEAQACKAEMETERLRELRIKEKSTDEQNHLYRFSSDVSYIAVEACMSKLTEWHRRDGKCAIEIVFSSPGGSIIDGFELFDFLQDLRNQGHKLTTGSLGMAASMAGVLLQAGDVRWLGHQSWLMIHRAAFGAIGKTYEVEDEVRFIKRIEDRIVDIFTSRSKLTKNKIRRNWDRKDWWIDADESLDLKLIDEIRSIMPEHSVNKNRKK